MSSSSSSSSDDNNNKKKKKKKKKKNNQTFVSFSESKMLCWLAVGVPNSRVYTHVQ